MYFCINNNIKWMIDIKEVRNRDDGINTKFWMGLERSLAATRHPRAVSGDVRRLGAEIQRHRAGRFDQPPVPGEDDRLREMSGMWNREISHRHVPGHPIARAAFRQQRRLQQCRRSSAGLRAARDA